MQKNILKMTFVELFQHYPYAVDFFISASLDTYNENLKQPIHQYFNLLTEDELEDLGISASKLAENLEIFIKQMEGLKQHQNIVESLSIVGGQNKFGEAEDIQLTINKGDVIAIIGPTGSGKSRLLADIECLAQGDTETKRKILVNQQEPTNSQRFRLENKLIAQLSQNMNFVMDLPVLEFLKLHGESRMIANIEETCQLILAEANELAGEKFSGDTPLTQLSGGQSRALMIADTALLSASPIILIDEIENAGVDRKKALELLMQEEKIVLMSTHDPLLALMGAKRLVIENGGIKKIIETSAEERENLIELEKIDSGLMKFRQLLRNGEKLEFPLDTFFE